MISVGLDPNIVSYTILINGYCNMKKMDKAMHLFQEIPRKGLIPNIVTYYTVIQGLFRVQRCVVARKVFNELQATGLKPDFHAYCVMLDGLCKNGYIEEALSLLSAIENDEVISI